MTRVLAPQLSYSTVVPREDVHRSAISEVYLTDIICEQYPKFRLGIQLPRQHSYYSDHFVSGTPSYDPLLLLECSRQASILIAHRFVGADMDQKFIFNSGALHISNADALAVQQHPGYGILDATIVAEKTRDGQVTGISLVIDIDLDSKRVATMEMVIAWMPGGAWDKVRSRGRAELDLTAQQPHSLSHRSAPELVARRSSENVMIGAVSTGTDELTAEVVVDERHPSLFDHRLDHIPGAVIFEAMRQTAVTAAHELFGLSPQRLGTTAICASFLRFGELELATTTKAVPLKGSGDLVVGLEVEVSQNGTVITEG